MKSIVIMLVMLCSWFAFAEELDFKTKLEESAVKTKMNLETMILGKVLAISEFTCEKKERGILLSDFYSNYLDKTKISLVDRKETSKIMDEIKLELVGIAEEKNVAKLGKMAGADYLLTGNMILIADKTFVNVKVIEVATGKVFYSDMVSFKTAEIETVAKLEDFYKEKKYPITAAFRSVVVPGWGQLYNDEPVKGGIITGSVILGTLATIYFAGEENKYKNTASEDGQYEKDIKSANDNHNKMMIALTGTALVWGWNILDAYLNAK